MATLETRPATALEIYRRAVGLGRAQLAELAHVSTESIARYERRERTPRLQTAQAIARVLSQPVDVLFPGQAANG
jgi:DNA-binding XRE family transcriptional regulator